jgi:vacuolar-type H+-ATPase subunit H
VSNQTPVRDLERLVEAEARLDDLLRAAREEAGRLIAEARDRAGRAEERWTADYQAACQDLKQRVAEERDRELTRIRDETERLTAQYVGLSAERIEALAGWVASELRSPTVRRHTP